MSKDSPHVLTLTPFYPVLGDDAQGCFVAEPMRNLEALGVRQTIFAVQPFYRGALIPNPVAPKAREVSFISLPGGFGLPTSGLFLFASIIREVRRIHTANPIDVIHAHAAMPCGHAAVLLKRELDIPFVVSVHGLDAYSTKQVTGLSGHASMRISSMVYRSADCIICVSEKVREQVVRGLISARTVVVYNGVDPEIFSPEQKDCADFVLSVGGLIPIKGHEVLIRGFAKISRDFPGFTCEIIGDGPERSKLENIARELGIAKKVRFRGRLSRGQVAALMRRCAVFALPSRYEALGCVYLEAMAAGKAVIAGKDQGIEEIIQSGYNGCLVSPTDVSQLSDALAALLEDAATRRRIGIAARETVLAGLTFDHQARALKLVYEQCAQ